MWRLTRRSMSPGIESKACVNADSGAVADAGDFQILHGRLISRHCGGARMAGRIRE